jgi:hypothetical protein
LSIMLARPGRLWRVDPAWQSFTVAFSVYPLKKHLDTDQNGFVGLKKNRSAFICENPCPLSLLFGTFRILA